MNGAVYSKLQLEESGTMDKHSEHYFFNPLYCLGPPL